MASSLCDLSARYAMGRMSVLVFFLGFFVRAAESLVTNLWCREVNKLSNESCRPVQWIFVYFNPLTEALLCAYERRCRHFPPSYAATDAAVEHQQGEEHLR